MEACQGVEALVLDLIPVEQGEGAPCQVEQEEAWASEAFLHTIKNQRQNFHLEIFCGESQIKGPISRKTVHIVNFEHSLSCQ